MFQSLENLPVDPILGMMAIFRADERPNKVDLSVGVFKDSQGNTPIFDAVKKAESYRLETEDTKAYIGIPGTAGFNKTMLSLILGDGLYGSLVNRLSAALTPGGSGALRVAAELIVRTKNNPTIWVSDPTWGNHTPLISSTGLTMKSYPYFDKATHGVRFDAMMDSFSSLGENDIVLFHACCHNPTGADLSPDQWDQIADLALDRGFIPFVDCAYQGLADDLDSDAYGVRKLASTVPEMIIASSCSKNFGLYRERVGQVAVLSQSAHQSGTSSNMMLAIRTMYSMPPAHGGAIVEHILETPDLRASWQAELADICSSIHQSRHLLADGLNASKIDTDFSYLTANKGMFSYLALSKEQIDRLRNEHAVYLLSSGRINLAGAHAGNIHLIVAAMENICL